MQSYKKILYNFSKLPIYLKDFNMLTKNHNYNFFEFNSKLHKLMHSINCNDYSLINKIIISKNEVNFCLKNLKKYLLKYFNIENENVAIKQLQKLINDINLRGFDAIDGYSPYIDRAIKNYMQGIYIDSSSNNRNSKMKKKAKKEFLEKTISDINSFIDLLYAECKYSLVNQNIFNSINFDDDKLGLYLAYNVMKYAEHAKKNGEEKEYQNALIYLDKYINDNIELVKNSFSFFDRNHKVKYDINYIYVYLKRNRNLNNIESEEKVKRYNYNFFECDPSKGIEILKSLYLFSDENNEQYLKDLLERKIEFYTNLNFTQVKVGINSFDGYIGFKLDNNYVILDKFFENMKEGRISTNNAIYIVDDDDFLQITKMSKSNVIEQINSGTIKAKRILHSGKYEERVKKYIKSKSLS